MHTYSILGSSKMIFSKTKPYMIKFYSTYSICICMRNYIYFTCTTISPRYTLYNIIYYHVNIIFYIILILTCNNLYKIGEMYDYYYSRYLDNHGTTWWIHPLCRPYSQETNNGKRAPFSLRDAFVPGYSWLFHICVLRRIRRMISCRLFGV